MAEQRTAAELEQEIEDLKRRWPAHSVPAAMIERLEELEDALLAVHAIEAAQHA